MLADGTDPDLLHAATTAPWSSTPISANARTSSSGGRAPRTAQRPPVRRWAMVQRTRGRGRSGRRFSGADQVYPRGFAIPRRFIGENIIHLPTVKTHVFTTTTGAMKNAFGGLLNEHRHWTHPVIHETLVDLLRIQQRIHSGLFAVMDGTFAGAGPGPRCMTPHVKNVILASADQVAIDAVAAKLMGFDPWASVTSGWRTTCGLGCGDPDQIALVGDAAAAEESWNFEGPLEHLTWAARMQHRIYWGRSSPGWSGRSRPGWRPGPTWPRWSTTMPTGTRPMPGRRCSPPWPAIGAACSPTGPSRADRDGIPPLRGETRGVQAVGACPVRPRRRRAGHLHCAGARGRGVAPQEAGGPLNGSPQPGCRVR